MKRYVSWPPGLNGLSAVCTNRCATILMIVVSLVSGVACDRSVPHDRLADAELPPGTQITPGASEDPDIAIDAELRKELNDDCLRVDLVRVKLRCDRGGVLVIRRGDGTVRFIDLDGSGEVTFNSGRAQLSIDAETIDDVELRPLRSHGGKEWYLVSGGENGVIVIPAL